MNKNIALQFQKMDELSQKGTSFFFVVDFLMTKVEVFTEEQLLLENIQVVFPNFKKVKDFTTSDKKMTFESFPEFLEDYQKGFEIVQRNLNAGNSYLTNYTRKTKVKTNLTLEEIFHRSSAKYKVFFKDEFVFFSPETFIETKGNKIFTHPMKGTIEADEPNAEEKLKNDIKEKAEHYTVVDLLRNDLSQVAKKVSVKEFQRIDFIKTHRKNLLAMSSEIVGEIRPEFQGKVGNLMSMLLPAGSILGAPKTKTLEITLEAEKYHRNFYTGIAGWYDGTNLDTCVMIRFLEKENNQLFFKSGGGITHRSNLKSEYEEFKNKIYVPIH